MTFKEFIKLTKGKIIWTIVLILIAIGLWYLLAMNTLTGGQAPLYAPIFAIFSFFTLFSFTKTITTFSILLVIIEYYLISCLIMFIYNKMKRKNKR